MRDYYSVRHWFIQGQVDYISYYKGLRFWVDNELSFVESDTFRKSKLEVKFNLFRTSSSMAKLLATIRQSGKWPIHKY